MLDRRELGYGYYCSPLICDNDETPPTLVDTKYQPTTRPGSRLPHVWLNGGVALHDLIGDDFIIAQPRCATAIPCRIDGYF